MPAKEHEATPEDIIPLENDKDLKES